MEQLHQLNTKQCWPAVSPRAGVRGIRGLSAGASHALQLGRVVMDTIRIRLGVIFGSTFLSGTIPQAHLLLMGLNSLEVKYLATTSSITSLKNKNRKLMSKHLLVCALKQYHLLLVLAYAD